jgi:hypothetical protein
MRLHRESYVNAEHCILEVVMMSQPTARDTSRPKPIPVLVHVPILVPVHSICPRLIISL